MTLTGWVSAAVLLAASAGAGFASAGQTYYIDSAGGSDGFDGLSAETAWKSLEKVNGAVFEAGDRVLFKAGTVYAGQLRPQGSGTPEKPICIDLYGRASGERFSGLARIDAEGQYDGALVLSNVQGWEVRNLELTNTGPERQARRSGAIVRLRDFGTARHIVLSGLYIHDVNGSVVKQQGGGQAILFQSGGRQTPSRFDGLTIEGCLLRRCERNGIIGGGNTRRDSWFPSVNVAIRGNVLEEIPGDGIVPQACDGAVIEYNLMRDCPRLLPDTEAAAGIWPWGCDNTVIQFNEVSDHKAPWDAQGFDSDWNCRGTIIQYNVSHHNEGGFLLVCNKSDVGMPQNIGTVGTIVRYNLSFHDGLRAEGKHAGFSPVFHLSGRLDATRIYNNTIVVPKKPDGRIDREMLRMDNWGGKWPVNTHFVNNIFYVEDETRYTFGQDEGTVFANNLYFGTHTGLPTDAAGIFADPRFAAGVRMPGVRWTAAGWRNFLEDPWVKRFGLAAESTAAGKAAMVGDGGETDLLGRALPTEQRSLGAIEATRD